MTVVARIYRVLRNRHYQEPIKPPPDRQFCEYSGQNRKDGQKLLYSLNAKQAFSARGRLDSHRQNGFIVALGFGRFVSESRPAGR